MAPPFPFSLFVNSELHNCKSQFRSFFLTLDCHYHHQRISYLSYFVAVSSSTFDIQESFGDQLCAAASEFGDSIESLYYRQSQRCLRTEWAALCNYTSLGAGRRGHLWLCLLCS